MGRRNPFRIPRRRSPFQVPRGTKRPQNVCKQCRYSWYPRGKSLSLKCPRCGSTETAVGCGGFAMLLALCFLLGLTSAAFALVG
jgi:hypothetical protein